MSYAKLGMAAAAGVAAAYGLRGSGRGAREAGFPTTHIPYHINGSAVVFWAPADERPFDEDPWAHSTYNDEVQADLVWLQVYAGDEQKVINDNDAYLGEILYGGYGKAPREGTWLIQLPGKKRVESGRWQSWRAATAALLQKSGSSARGRSANRLTKAESRQGNRPEGAPSLHEFASLSRKDSTHAFLSAAQYMHNAYGRWPTNDEVEGHLSPADRKELYQFWARGRAARGRRAEREGRDYPEVGDILHASWGYDQTNNNYYEVISLRGKTMVELREVEKRTVNYGTGTITVEPIPGDFKGDSLRRKWKKGYGGPGSSIYGVDVSSSQWATLWNGKPNHETAWGWGH